MGKKWTNVIRNFSGLDIADQELMNWNMALKKLPRMNPSIIKDQKRHEKEKG